MKKLIYFTGLIVLVTSCVSKKQYAELEAQLAQQESKQVTVEAMKKAQAASSASQQTVISDMQMEVDQLKQLIGELNAQIESQNIPPLTPEQMQQREEERIQEREFKMMQMQQQQMNSEAAKMMEDSDMAMRMTRAALDGVAEQYDAGQMMVEPVGSRLVVTIKDDALFTGDKESLSNAGETLLKRITPALEVAEGLDLMVVGISPDGSAEALSEAATKTNTLADQWNGNAAFDKLGPVIGTRDCKNAFSKRQTNCDKLELVFSHNYENVMKAVMSGH